MIIDDRIPNPDGGRGYPRAFELVRLLARRHKVTYFPTDDRIPREPWTTALQSLEVECITDGRSLTELLSNRPRFYSSIIVSRPNNFAQCLPVIRSCAADATLIYDAEALYFAREEQRRRVLGLPLDNDFKREREKELTLLDAATRIIVVSDHEKKILAGYRPDMADRTCVWSHPTGIRLTPSPFEKRRDLLFVGAFTEGGPNEDAVVHFANVILPIVRRSLKCKLFVAGADTSDAVRKLASNSVEVLGYVPDLEPYYDRCRIFVVPHRFAGGISLKLLEAMGRGLPAVVTPLIAEQLALDESTVMIGCDDKEFAQKLIELHADEALWNRLRKNARAMIKAANSSERLEKTLNEIMTFSRKRAAA